VILLQIFTGGDFSSLLGGGGGLQAGRHRVRDSELRDGCRRQRERRLPPRGGSKVINSYWATQVQGPAAAAHHRRRVDADIVRHGIERDRSLLLPAGGDRLHRPDVLRRLEQQFGDKAGDLAQLYVLAHEYGHHIQQITGIFDQYPNNGTGPDSNGVRTELQADCFAGAWVADAAQQTDAHGVAYIQTPTDAQIATRSPPRRRSATTTSSSSRRAS
jgi:hypothetical protein